MTSLLVLLLLEGADIDSDSKRALCGVNTRHCDYNHHSVVVVEVVEVGVEVGERDEGDDGNDDGKVDDEDGDDDCHEDEE